jgi:hypothetical protein
MAGIAVTKKTRLMKAGQIHRKPMEEVFDSTKMARYRRLTAIASRFSRRGPELPQRASDADISDLLPFNFAKRAQLATTLP